MSILEKSRLREKHEQLIYWASIGFDIISPRKKSGIYVLGYTKSGTNWLCHLVSGILEMPILESWKLNLPRFTPCVYHMHRIIPIDAVRRRTIYMMRDGRDTMVSRYFHIVREGGIAKAKLEKYLGHPASANNVKNNMAKFIRFMQTSNVATTDYRSHIKQWEKHKDIYVTLRYEDLLTNPIFEITRAITEVSHTEPDPNQVRKIVEQHDFTRLTKRKKGTEDANSFTRKGISGDWVNYFTPEAATVFDDYAGDLLLELGYEDAPNWASHFGTSIKL